jgi:hypothetical protein
LEFGWSVDLGGLEMDNEKKAEELLLLIHEFKHGWESPNLREEFTAKFPFWRWVENYNPVEHKSAVAYLFDVVLKVEN